MTDEKKKEFESIFDDVLQDMLKDPSLSSDEAKAKLSAAFLDALVNKQIMARLISRSMGELMEKSRDAGVPSVEAVISLFLEVASVAAVTLIKISSEDNAIENARETFEQMAQTAFSNGVNLGAKFDKMKDEEKNKEKAEAEA